MIASSSASRAEQEYSPRSRAERLIAAGRLVLAVFSLLAIRFDPTEPARYASTAYSLLSAYVVYASALVVLAARSPTPLTRFSVVTHVVDLGIFTLFMYFTEGPTSPFFVYFVFALLCAMLRWQWRGTLWTGAATLALFIAMGVYAAEVLRDETFELNRFIIRSVYLVVVAVLLGYLGAYERRTRDDMARLAAWPQPGPQEPHALVRGVLEHSAAILGAPRAVMVWEEPEEAWLHVASWSGEAFDWVRHPPDAFRPLVAGPLVGASFLCADVRAPLAAVLRRSASGFERWAGAPLHPALVERFAMKAVLAVNVAGDTTEGRLFFLDRPGMTSDELVLGDIVARQVAARMDLFYVSDRLKRAAAVEERMRLARDLHDGLLQSLTGMALHLRTACALLDEQAPAARDRLLEIQRLILAEQRDLRSLIQYLKPAPRDAPAAPDLVASLHILAMRIERDWGARVELRLEAAEGRVPPALAREIYHMIHEAAVNAVKHGGASTVRVELRAEDDRVRISVADNGHGFPDRGHYDQAALVDLKLGPATLKARVAAVGGSLAIDSWGTGARLEMTLPLAPSGA